MKISPSILTSNFLDLENEIKSISTADYIHLDIMDGNFVPNISFGPYISSVISNKTSNKLDIHLMVNDPLFWIPKFNFYNTEYITIHVESNNFLEAFNKIKELKIKAGICIKPNTNVSEIMPYLKDADLVLVMTVEPGFGGQVFMENAAKKIVELHELRVLNNYNYLIEVDGGINLETKEIVKSYNVDILVVGSYLFNSTSRKELIEELKK